MEKHSLACQLNKQFIHRNLFLYDVAMFVLLLFLSVSVPYLSLFSFCKVYFPEKGCHLGTNRSDNET